MSDFERNKNPKTSGIGRQPLVGTYITANTDGSSCRGVEILDADGGLTSINDEALPRVIALLALHLSGVEINMVSQELASKMSLSDEIEEAIADVDQRLLMLKRRRDRLIAKRDEESTRSYAVEMVTEQVSFDDLVELLIRKENDHDV
ncbi:hypothetical protein SD80_012795 [Scytonema tolypothrichoides VB-61278]|nr:hypothetical protein SD80_012795 [Scytonema tolypothrichoides VB-61278]